MPILVIGEKPEGKDKPNAVGGMRKFGRKPDEGDTGGDTSPDTKKQKEQAARIFFKAGQAGDFGKAAAALETFITCCDDGEEAAEDAEDDTEEEAE